MNLKKESSERLWKMTRNAMFKENMDVGMKTMFHLHNRVYAVKDFDMVSLYVAHCEQYKCLNVYHCFCSSSFQSMTLHMNI